MKSNASGSSTYRSLAQQRAVVVQELEVDSLPRFGNVCEAVQDIAAELNFDHDGQARVKVSGRVHCKAQLSCHRCDENVWRHVDCSFASVIAFDEEQADAWSGLDPSLDILVVAGVNLDMVELVEDELLLALPDRVCTDDDCAHMPVMRFGEAAGDDVDTQGSGKASRRFPFAGLKEAIQASDKEQD
jgi:uncharacterized metal-binding protein YceD (DUF177 family)